MARALSSVAETRADRILAWAVFCLLLAAYLASFAGLPENPDSEVEFQTTRALAVRGSFALGGTPEAEAIVGVVHQGRQGFNVRRGGPGREHELFSWSGVGQPLVAVPLYALGAALERVFPRIEARHRATSELGVGRSEYFQHLLVGLRNPLLDPVIARLGLQYVAWSRRGFDTITREPARVLARLTRSLAAGDILLMHDGTCALTPNGRPVVLEVLPPLLELIAARGLKCVSLPRANL